MATMDASIILQGQAPNIMGAISGANDAAQNQRNYLRQREVEQLYKTEGAGMLAGNQSSLNALAGYDPNAAQGLVQNQLGMDQTRQQMSINAEEMQMKRDEGKRMAAEAIRSQAEKLTKEQAAAEAAKVESGIAAASTAQTAEQWDRIVTQFGVPDLVGQFADKDGIIASYMGVAEALKEFNPEPAKPADDYQRYVQEESGKGATPLGRIEYAQAIKGNGPEETIYGPDGQIILQRGGKGGGKATEGNLSAEGYLQRMRGAEEVFKTLETEGTVSLGLTDTPVVGTRFEPYKLSVPEQKLMQARRDWVRAKLRKESGAVIGEDEMAEEIRTYFPQPGEGPEVVAQKKEARKRAEEQMQIGAGFGATPVAGSGSPPPTGLPPQIQALPPEVQSVYEKYRSKPAAAPSP